MPTAHWPTLAGFTALLLVLPLIGRVFVLSMAYRAVLRHYPALAVHPNRARLHRSRDGLALLTLLCNAAAKQHPELYRYKVPLLRAVVARSRRREWWAQAHTHDQATTYLNTVAVFVETTIGPILDLPGVQLSAHISAEDARRYFRRAPCPNGRPWAGIPLQARAEEIARAYLDR
ncbi:MAG: hypothetical protein HC828_01500 [Blastochloris sp.]|nr:hypothetical protein [Blastochloris sp.]